MSFSGFSEPFMHKKLFELVKIAKNKLPNCKLEITTNGDILNVSKIRALYKLKLNSILVLKHKCFYTHYRLMIDHDGNVLLCSHDWTKKVSLGDLNKKSIYQIWTSKKIKKYRLALGKGNREFKPCNNCNVLGTLQGRKHYQAWNKYYS